MIERVLGEVLARNVPGTVARISFTSRNSDGTTEPFTRTRSVEKKLLPLRYTSCCTDPSTAKFGVTGLVELSTGSVAPATRTETDPNLVVSTTEVAAIERLLACGAAGAV